MTDSRILLLATSLAVGLALAGGSAYAADLAKGVVSEPAPDGAYVSVFGGYALSTSVHAVTAQTGVSVSVPVSAGYIVGGAIGTHLMPNLRGEVEASYSSHNAESGVAFGSGGGTGTASGSFGTLYLLGNVWYDIDTGSNITPYLGGGIGAAVIMPSVTIDPGGTYSTDTLAFAGQLGAGVKFALADNMSIDLGYRAKGVWNAQLTGSKGASNLTNLSYIDQAVQIGLTMGF